MFYVFLSSKIDNSNLIFKNIIFTFILLYIHLSSLFKFIINRTSNEKIENNPKKMFLEAINNLNNKYQNFNKITSDNLFKNNITLNGNIDIIIKSPILNYLKIGDYNKNLKDITNFLNNLEINYNLQKNDNEFLFNLESIFKNKELSLNYYIKNNDHYIRFDNYSDSYIKINDIINKIQNKLLYIDNDYLFEFFINNIASNIKDEYFISSKEEITLNDKKVNVTKNTLVLDRKNVTTILNNILSSAKEDEQTFKILNEYINDFENFNIDISDNLEDDIVLYFNTYSNNKLIKYELEVDNISKVLNIDINKFVITFLDSEIDFYVDDEKIANINYYNVDNKSITDIYVANSKILSAEFNNDEKEKSLILSSSNFNSNNFKLVLSQIMDKNETDYDKLDNELNFDFNIFGLNMLNIDITNTVNIYDFADIESYIEDDKILDITNIDFNKVKEILYDFIKI